MMGLAILPFAVVIMMLYAGYLLFHSDDGGDGGC